MLYSSWDMACDRCNCYFSFWAIFCPFSSLTARKINISKNWKRYLEIYSFYTIVPKIMILCYTVPEIWRMTDVIVIFHFRLFFPSPPPPSPPPPSHNRLNNENFKKRKNTWRYYHFTQLYQKLWLDDVRFLRYGAWRTDEKCDL